MSLRDEPIELAEALLTAYRAQIDAFVELADRFCQVVVGRNRYTQVGFLQAIESPLAELYFRASALPDEELWFSDDEDEAEGDAESPEGGLSGHEDGALHTDDESAFPILLTSRIDVSQQLEIMHDIEGLLGEFNLYREVYDPYGNDEALNGSLGDDIASLYALLATHLPLFRSREVPAMREALWNWRFGFDSHEGEHVTGALRAIYALLRQSRPHWDDDAWDDGRLVPFKEP